MFLFNLVDVGKQLEKIIQEIFNVICTILKNLTISSFKSVTSTNLWVFNNILIEPK